MGVTCGCEADLDQKEVEVGLPAPFNKDRLQQIEEASDESDDDDYMKFKENHKFKQASSVLSESEVGGVVDDLSKTKTDHMIEAPGK